MTQTAAARTMCVLLALAAATLTSGCSRPEDDGGKLLVAASIAPLANFAEEIGGNLVEVELLVPPGSSPHTYAPEPDQMQFLSRASLLVLNGGGLEFWADKAVDASDNPELVVVNASRGIPLLDSDEDEHGHDHGSGNPHVWLDPVYATRQVETIRDALIEADPENAEVYALNARRYASELASLDKSVKERVAKLSTRNFVAFHPAWVYFARRYGLRQAAVVEESPGKEPSAAHVRRVIDTLKRIDARAVFAEPQFSPRAAKVIAGETGARVLYLDPLGKPPHYDYIATMRENLRQIEKGLGTTPARDSE